MAGHRITMLCLVLLSVRFASIAAPADAQDMVRTLATGLATPTGLAVDGSGRLYVALQTSHQIVRFTPPSNIPSVFASSILIDYSQSLQTPFDMVFDNSGNLFVADFDNIWTSGRVWKITPGGATIPFALADTPVALTRDLEENLYVGEFRTRRVLKITPAGVVSTYVTAVGLPGGRLTMLHMDDTGVLYAGMQQGGEIYAIAPGGSPVTTFATGIGTTFEGQFVGYSVSSMAPRPGGGWLVACNAHGKIISVTPGGVPTLYAGGSGGFADGPVLEAKFNQPYDLVTVGNVTYVSDRSNQAIRAIDANGPTPATRTSWGRVKALYR